MVPPCCRRSGQIVNACAARVYDLDTRCSLRLPDPWLGWRLQGGVLVGPEGVRWTPMTLTLARDWQQRLSG